MPGGCIFLVKNAFFCPGIMTTLQITQLLPVPLRETLQSASSGVWRQQLSPAQGEQVLLVAPSGSGKTTLMHILYGLRQDYEGEVLWNGSSLRAMDSEALSQLRREPVSMVFQDLRLFPALTAWENLELKRALTGTVSAQEMSGWLQRLGIAHRRDAPAQTLSYGERQRVAIIRALLQPFQWLLMDEPFSHLDPANIRAAAALIAEVTARNRAGMLVAALEADDHFRYTKTLRL